MTLQELYDSFAGADPEAELSFDVNGKFAHFEHARVDGLHVVIVVTVPEAPEEVLSDPGF